ncbi:hypothetical protein Q4601_02840 [Shewanella sp. 1_MG-2023]|uniref:DUF6702 family protein n=1 Tax=unclassified Shewanella TaxID=196818 RepID=UPI0026E40F79|nr:MULTISPECIES: DUF6702 family protein [unclassified Shewanella]MDO6610630.1 hypothetical protein [Shewanella sp. 7_MG-2023]MDO6770755.1 hypothetical protein [Shewanella sp. 2_MG-2023]MDO6793227.1 hypothetical protein [Shewanella sp. 1_MG-2023]
MSRAIIAISLLFVAAFSFSTNTWAHQQKESYSNVLFNERTGNLEVQHRFYLHDAEHAAKRLFDSNTDLIKEPVSRDAFAYYVQDKFHIADDKQQTIKLNLVGTEVEGKYLWVYQETQINHQTMSSFYIKMESLQELWPSQLNYINVEREKQVKSLRLSAGDAWQHLSLDK